MYSRIELAARVVAIGGLGEALALFEVREHIVPRPSIIASMGHISIEVGTRAARIY